ncbi:MAG: protein translocase subunit SecF [Candidatus Paceibacterota bacterium]|jgi:preprotein translocase subunit SecF
MFIIKFRKVFFALSVVLIGLSVWAMFHYGLNFGIDFKGGSIVEVSYPAGRPVITALRSSIDTLNIGGYTLQPVGEKNFVLRTRELNQQEKEVVKTALSLNGASPVTEERFNTVGPAVGQDMRTKAFTAIIVVMLGIVLFVTYAFRKVSQPVASWKYGLATIIALAHDVLIPTGVFIIYAHFRTGEIDMLFVSALLAILGYSVHDTIVVFDRVRENLKLSHMTKNKSTFTEIVGASVTQTFARSINTSLTIFLVLLSLYVIGGEATRNFSFVLLVGIIAGTYSSIFIASPLLVVMEKWQKKS